MCLGSRLALVSGFFVPLARLAVVLRHAPTFFVKLAEVEHGSRVAVGSGLLVPLARLGVVLRHALIVVVKHAEVAHGAREAFLSRFFPAPCRSLVRRPDRSCKAR